MNPVPTLKPRLVPAACPRSLNPGRMHIAAFPRAKFLCHISHALQSLLTDFCRIITVNLYSRTDTDEKWINNNYNFGINDCRACNLWQRKFGRVLEPYDTYFPLLFAFKFKVKFDWAKKKKKKSCLIRFGGK